MRLLLVSPQKTLTAFAVLAMASASALASAGVYTFGRTDYLLESYLNGLDSVAVADLDGVNGPDIIVESLTAGSASGALNVLLNNGDGTFAPAQTFDSCVGASSIVVGQLNPATDSHLDVAMICGDQRLGRMFGDGQGHFAAPQTVDVSYLTGTSPVVIIQYLRLGSMNGPTLVYRGFFGIGATICFLPVPDLEYLIQNGPDLAGLHVPSCNIHRDLNEDIDDWGPVSNDIAVGEYTSYVGEPFARDEAVSGGVGSGMSQEIGVAVTGYTPFFQSTWSYGSSSSGNTGTAVALADLDGDQQNDLVIGGNDLSTSGDGNIAAYVPGFPIAPGAAPTHSFASIPYLYDLVTADFDVDGKLDIAAIGEDDFDDEGATIAIHRGNGNGTFAPYERFTARGYVSVGGGEPVIAVSDFDRNGRPDLVTVGRLDKWASVLLAPEPSSTLSEAACLGSLLLLARRRRLG